MRLMNVYESRGGYDWIDQKVQQSSVESAKLEKNQEGQDIQTVSKCSRGGGDNIMYFRTFTST